MNNIFLTAPQIRQAGSVRCCIIAPPIKPYQKMPLKIKFIKDDDEGILPYCEEEDAEKFYFQQILTARFSWGSNIIKMRGDRMHKDFCKDEAIVSMVGVTLALIYRILDNNHIAVPKEIVFFLFMFFIAYLFFNRVIKLLIFIIKYKYKESLNFIKVHNLFIKQQGTLLSAPL